jgi:sialidase-1
MNFDADSDPDHLCRLKIKKILLYKILFLPMKKFSLVGMIVFSLNFTGIYSGLSQSIPSNQIPIEYTSTVFQSGFDQYEFYRIPSLLSDGHRLFAFSEGRKHSVNDNGQIDIVVKISTDMGKTWGSLIKVTDFIGQSCQNPTPVYIKNENKILLLFTKRTIASDTEDKIRNGTSAGYVGAYITESLDHGITWSKVKEITDQVKLKNWLWYAFGPGGGIILRRGNICKGRIIIPANHSIPGGSGNEYLGAHIVYSDNQGESWHIGAVDSEGMGSVNPNELTVIETNIGTLYFNARNQNYQPDPLGNRAITFSRDGGASFARKFFHEPQLITPVVHASLARLNDRILFIAPSNPSERKNLSIWISDDEALTWTTPQLLQAGWSAYSSSVSFEGEMVGVLYETGKDNPYQMIQFMLINPD